MNDSSKKALLRTAVFIGLVVSIFGCHDGQVQTKEVAVAVRNDDTNAYWANLKWAGPGVPVGILSQGSCKTAIGVPWPNVSSARLELMDDKTREKFSIEVPCSFVADQIKTGNIQVVTFDILSRTNAKVTCE